MGETLGVADAILVGIAVDERLSGILRANMRLIEPTLSSSENSFSNGRPPAQPAGAPTYPRHARYSRASTSLPRRRSRMVEASSTVTGTPTQRRRMPAADRSAARRLE